MDRMTLNEYLKAVNSDVKNKQKYLSRYESIKSQITSQWYKLKDTNNVVVVLSIPSEKAKNVKYNVILEFESASTNETARNLMMSDMKVFSNCPSFVFMNAKLFEEKGFLLSWAKELYDPRVFADTEEAKIDTTAPATSKDVRCEKSLYYAALYIKSLSPITILSYLSRAWVVKDTKTLLWNIKDSNKVLERRLARAKKHPIKKDSSTKKNSTKGSSMTHNVKSIKSTKSISKIKHI